MYGIELLYFGVKLRAQGEFGEFWMKNQGMDVKEIAPDLFSEFSGQIQGAIEVLRIPYRVPCMVGGSFRCAHQPLIRR